MDTLRYYEEHAQEFVADTVGACMDDALGRFLRRVPAGGCVLDWGCGSGRDARAMIDAGYAVEAADASPAMCRAAAGLTGLDVRCETFADLDRHDAYNGIWACASLLHVPRGELAHVFGLAARALKADGTLYCSFKLGTSQGQRGGRWFTDMDESLIREVLAHVPALRVVELWTSADVRPGRESERWLNCLMNRGRRVCQGDVSIDTLTAVSGNS